MTDAIRPAHICIKKKQTNSEKCIIHRAPKRNRIRQFQQHLSHFEPDLNKKMEKGIVPETIYVSWKSLADIKGNLERNMCRFYPGEARGKAGDVLYYINENIPSMNFIYT